MNLEERLDRLEMELAHQQRVTDQLNEVVTQQALQLLRQQRAIQVLGKQIEKLSSDFKPEQPLDLADEKPPHY